MNDKPIGIFDSGLGGLTVVKEIINIMPNENIVYLGDIGRVPYGSRSKKVIEKYTSEDINFLMAKDIKMIISACGTVSSNVICEDLICEKDILYTGVLVPAVKKACSVTNNKCLGVIGTSATIRSGKYQDTIKNIDKEINVIVKDCPLFVPLVENGFFCKENEITKSIVHHYLDFFVDKIDTLILGCTHYPIIKNTIGEVLGDSTKLIDSGKETAKYAKKLLQENNLLNKSNKTPNYEFYVSDDPVLFKQNASIFLNRDVCNNIIYVNLDNF